MGLAPFPNQKRVENNENRTLVNEQKNEEAKRMYTDVARTPRDMKPVEDRALSLSQLKPKETLTSLIK